MKKYETNKLFYNKYLYRLQIFNGLATIFREKNLPAARQVLDRLQQQFENNEPLAYVFGVRNKPVAENTFHDAKRLLKVFSKEQDFKLRVEKNYINVYSNNKLWLLENISDCICTEDGIVSFHEPREIYKDLLSNRTILVDKDNGYQYKVTLGNKEGSPEFAMWAENNPKLVKLSPVLKEESLNKGWVSGYYFYARDDKTLNLLQLLTDNIRRIDKLILKSNLDK